MKPNNKYTIILLFILQAIFLFFSVKRMIPNKTDDKYSTAVGILTKPRKHVKIGW